MTDVTASAESASGSEVDKRQRVFGKGDGVANLDRTRSEESRQYVYSGPESLYGKTDAMKWRRTNPGTLLALPTL